MKPKGTCLILLAWPIALLADGPDNPTNAHTKTSAHISAMIKADLPGYTPPPATAQPSPPPAQDEAAVTRDPAVLELEKITVREKRPQQIEALDLLNESARGKKLARDFRDSIHGLDGLLNGFSIPILSPSMAERGRVYRQQQQLSELNRIGNAVRKVDPKAAGELNKTATDAQRAIDYQNRPAGDD